MTHLFRTPRFLMLAASTAVVVGGVLTPTGAFAATPAIAHAAVADDRAAAPADDGGADNRGLLIGTLEKPLLGTEGDAAGTGDATGPKTGPDGGDRIQQPTGTHTRVCVRAPCEQPDSEPVPDLPGIPDLPGLPDAPDAPDVPDLPDLPGFPGVPGFPAFPGVPHSGDVTAPNG
ncbi:hypothetical protein ACFVFI_08475 [Streptomyces sp. NPDC057705]|uniref:hypothetical protein n=1 Tax=Streptomyces sp. NPDC057705 TaxID=3346222 RepID=UPI0036C7B072